MLESHFGICYLMFCKQSFLVVLGFGFGFGCQSVLYLFNSSPKAQSHSGWIFLLWNYLLVPHDNCCLLCLLPSLLQPLSIGLVKTMWITVKWIRNLGEGNLFLLGLNFRPSKYFVTILLCWPRWQKVTFLFLILLITEITIRYNY